MTRRLVLLPPSEGKTAGGEGPPVPESMSTHPLWPLRIEVVEALQRHLRTRGAAERLFGLRDGALARAVAADEQLLTSPTLPAWQRYDGVLHQHLDATSFDARTRRRFNSSVRTLSGLWGVVSPDEPIPDYRLKMGARLPRIGRLSTWWRDAVSAHLARRARAADEVWNLLPQEHAAAWRAPSGVVECSATFLRPSGGRLVAVSHWNKALKGSLVAHLLRHPDARAEDLEDWDHPAGYRLDPSSLEPVDGRRALRFVARG